MVSGSTMLPVDIKLPNHKHYLCHYEKQLLSFYCDTIFSEFFFFFVSFFFFLRGGGGGVSCSFFFFFYPLIYSLVDVLFHNILSFHC